MIKANELDVEDVREFVNGHVAKPNWMQMQLPLGMTKTATPPVLRESINIE